MNKLKFRKGYIILLFVVLLIPINATSAAPSLNFKTYLPATMNGQGGGTKVVTGGVITSSKEINAWPQSGAGWNNIKDSADQVGSDPDFDIPDLTNQNNKNNLKVLAQAIVYARSGNIAYRKLAHDGIMAVIGTEQVGANNSILALGRQLGGYVFAADLIGLQGNYPADYAIFREWLWNIRIKNLGGHSVFVMLKQTHSEYASNWATFAGASRIAADAYLLNDPKYSALAKDDLSQAAHIFAAWLGDRNQYPGGGYFKPTAGYDPSWSCDPANWTAINPPCTKTAPTGESINLDGAIVSDISRGGAFSATPGSDGISYSWEVLQGAFVQAEILYRLYLYNPGLYPYPVYSWSNKALERAMNFMRRINGGWALSTPDFYVPWMESYRYGLAQPTFEAKYGRVFGFSDWFYFGK